MSKIITYGIGGYCENCDETHDHPLHNIVEEIEIPDPPAQPLNQTGALATLLAVTEVVSVEDAANAVGLTPQDLIVEAQAWVAAQTLETNS
jgi:hypothetical protein